MSCAATMLRYALAGTEYWQNPDPASAATTRACNGGEDLTCSAAILSAGINAPHLTVRVAQPPCSLPVLNVFVFVFTVLRDPSVDYVLHLREGEERGVVKIKDSEIVYLCFLLLSEVLSGRVPLFGIPIIVSARYSMF